jgi:hypothetical protein
VASSVYFNNSRFPTLDLSSHPLRSSLDLAITCHWPHSVFALIFNFSTCLFTQTEANADTMTPYEGFWRSVILCLDSLS